VRCGDAWVGGWGGPSFKVRSPRYKATHLRTRASTRQGRIRHVRGKLASEAKAHPTHTLPGVCVCGRGVPSHGVGVLEPR
jgi:hypothetical protein